MAVARAASNAARAASNPWLIAVLVALATFMEVLDTTIANVVLPYIAGGMGVSQDESSWVITTYLVANAVALTASSTLARYLGRKRFFLICLALFTASSLLCGYAWSLDTLLLFRILQGLGGGGMVPLSQSILADSFPPEKRGQAFALFGVAVVVAPVVGPTLGGWMADNMSWRWCFEINGPVGMMAFVLIAMLFHESPKAIAERTQRLREGAGFDFVGFLLVALFLGTLEIVLDRGLRGRLVQLLTFITMHHGGAVRAGVRADGPVGNAPPQPRGRCRDDRDAAVRRVVPRYGGDRRHSLRDHAIHAATGAGGVRLHRNLGRAGAVAGRPRHDGRDVRRRSIDGEGPAEVAADRRRAAGRGLDVPTHQHLRGTRVLVAFAEVANAAGTRAPAADLPAGGLARDHRRRPTACPPARPEARRSAMLNAARNTGGSIGISIASNVLAHREQFHQSRLIEHAIPSVRSNMQDTLSQVTQFFVQQGNSLIQAQQQAMQWIGQQVQTQAALLAYMDVFWVLMLISLAAVPLALTLRSVKLGGAGPAAH